MRAGVMSRKPTLEPTPTKSSPPQSFHEDPRELIHPKKRDLSRVGAVSVVAHIGVGASPRRTSHCSAIANNANVATAVSDCSFSRRLAPVTGSAQTLRDALLLGEYFFSCTWSQHFVSPRISTRRLTWYEIIPARSSILCKKSSPLLCSAFFCGGWVRTKFIRLKPRKVETVSNTYAPTDGSASPPTRNDLCTKDLPPSVPQSHR